MTDAENPNKGAPFSLQRSAEQCCRTLNECHSSGNPLPASYGWIDIDPIEAPAEPPKTYSRYSCVYTYDPVNECRSHGVIDCISGEVAFWGDSESESNYASEAVEYLDCGEYESEDLDWTDLECLADNGECSDDTKIYPICSNTIFLSTAILPDTGGRTEFESGAVRDSSVGKGVPSDIPPCLIRAVAKRFEDGATKYARGNWRKGISLSRYQDAIMRHTLYAAEGDTSEDHLGAVAWNAGCWMWTLEQIEKGRLPAELNDLPYDEGSE